MYKRFMVILGLFVTALIFSGCITTSPTPLQRRTFESKDLQGDFDDAFKATLQVMQDYGYIIKNSDYEAGVIQGATGTKKNLLGFMSHYEITATIEQFGDNLVKERLTLVLHSKVNTKGGVQENSKIVDDPELFQRLYDDIQKEMFIRANLSK